MNSGLNSFPAVVILSAGSSKKKMPGFPIFKDSPAFLPVNCRSLGKLVIDFYLNKPVSDIYLVINETDYEDAVKEFGCFGHRLKIISIPETNSVIDTVTLCLQEVVQDEVIVNIVSSVPDVFIDEVNCIGINKEVTLIEGWAGVILREENVRLMSKIESRGKDGYSFSGIFRARKRDILDASSKVLVDDHRQDLMELIKKINETNKIKVIHFSWNDCGRVQNYYKTRMKIFGSRFFNSITLDSKTGILTKTSSNKDKLKREIDYTKLLPNELTVYYPRILSSDFSGEAGVVRMEYYAYPSLAEIMLYWELPKSIWESIIQNLGLVLTRFSAYKDEAVNVDWSDIYLKKVISRVDEFKNSVEKDLYDLFFINESIVINNEQYEGWVKLRDKYIREISKINTSCDSTIIHGDFCFNNILCEPYSGLIKLLDARGSFGIDETTIYGDRKYDIAKLGHSIIGRYDYIVNDLYQIVQSGDGFCLNTFDRPWQVEIDNLFKELLEEKKIDRNLIYLIIGSLFISMPPMHSDNRNRQKAFFLQGIKFLNISLVEKKNYLDG